MRSLAEDFAEWILQETKDLLQTIEILTTLGNQGINTELSRYQQRVTTIQDKFVRKFITPMRRIGRGTSGSKNEHERVAKFKTALENVLCVIQELRKIRGHLEMIAVTVEHIETANARDNATEPHYIS